MLLFQNFLYVAILSSSVTLDMNVFNKCNFYLFYILLQTILGGFKMQAPQLSP